MAKPTPVAPAELLGRFLIENQVNLSSGIVLSKAFSPHRERKDLSVYRVSNLPEGEIWEISETFARRGDDKPYVGRADIVAAEYTSQGLGLDADGDPHPMHTNIVNWPVSEAVKLTRIKARAAKFVAKT